MPQESIFEPDELEAAATEPDAAPPADEQPKPEPERDEHGRFKAREPEGEGEQPAEQPGDAEEGKRGDGTVPQGALHAERERRKTVEAELAAAKGQLEALAAMRKQIADRKPQDLPAADDPAAMEHLRTRLTEMGEQQTRLTQRLDSDAVHNEEVRQLGSVMATSEAAYRETQPDYDAAINHVVQARAQELTLYGLSPAEINQTISEEATEIVRVAVQRGMDPAELGYKIALSRGYRPEQPQTPSNGGASATIEAIARAQGASKSLGNGGGSSSQQLNAQAIAAMSQDEFDALYSTPEGRALIDAL